MASEQYPIGKNVKVDPGNTKYAGIYVRRNADGVKIWRIYYRIGTKQVWETLGSGYTKESARNIREERLQKIRVGEYQGPSTEKITFEKAWEIYEKWAENNVGAKTLRGHQLKWQNHIKKHLGHYQMRSITPVILEQWKGYLLKQSGLKEQTACGVMTLAITVWNKVTKLGYYVGRNPWDQVDRIRKQVFRKRFLSMEEAKDILNTFKGMGWTREFRQASFCLLAGLRFPSEIQDLTPMSIDMDKNVITIGHTKGKVKGGDDSRTIPLVPVLKSMVQEMLAEKPIGPMDQLFPSINYDKWQSVFEPYNEGIPTDMTSMRISPYTLRHTYASWMLAGGCNLKTLQELMGHAQFQMTSDIYSHVAPGAAAAAQQVLQKNVTSGALEGVWNTI